jgi:hypothetical protein
MSERLEWWHWLVTVGIIAFGVYTLLTGDWHLRGNPYPTMARVGGGALVFIGLIAIAYGLGWIGRDSE